jgi:type IX secretion system PorP/SprF family membrane protein
MKKMKCFFLLPAALGISLMLKAQDPSFSQFFASPLNVNPALTANINGKWRMITHYRNQWIGPSNPYQTGTVSFDSKIFQNTVANYVDEITRVGIGGMFMYDQAMAGAVKSNYASFNMSGNIRLGTGNRREMNGGKIRHISKIKMDRNPEHRLGIGIGIIYGHRRVDYSKLDFEDQFTGNGFDTNLPTGEAGLSNMKPYLSTSAGILYSYVGENSNFDLGVSAFHLNKPKQSFLSDDNQVLASRYVAHANFETNLTDLLFLNTNGIYQYQSGASYFSVGGNLGYHLPSGEKQRILNAGLWYWSNNAVIPYVGFTYGNFQAGLNYDFTISELNKAPRRAHTFELCLIFRGEGSSDKGVIPAPWK